MPEKQMTFLEHLEELRQRLKYALIAVVVGIIVAYIFSDVLFVLLAQPLIEAWQNAGLGRPKLHFADPIEPFLTYMKVALVGGLFLSAPVVFYQLWQFVAPGLYKHEKRYAIPFAVVSAVFFIGGACFGYFVVFPYGFRFFLSYANANMGSFNNLLGGTISFSVKQTFELQPTLMMGEYFSLVWHLLFGFGIVFELPLLIFFLSIAGFVSVRSLWRFNRYFIIIAFTIGAVLTPGPDVLTQVFMAVPLIILYNLSILVALIVKKRKKKTE